MRILIEKKIDIKIIKKYYQKVVLMIILIMTTIIR